MHDYQKIAKEQTIYTTIIERRALPVHQTRIPNLSIVPSHILLSNTDIELTIAKDHREARLKSELDKIKDQYDFVFIDNPPALGWLTLNSFTASDKVLVVVSPGYFELDSLVQLGKTLEEVREYYNKNLDLLGYLFTMSEPTLNTSASLQILRQTYTEKVLFAVLYHPHVEQLGRVPSSLLNYGTVSASPCRFYGGRKNRGLNGVDRIYTVGLRVPQ